jgi:acetyl-CoA C-acetyltransferase
MDKNKIVIIEAKRSAIGNFLGGLSHLKAHEITAQILKEIFKNGKINPNEISEVILGQVLTAGQGQNPARQASILGGIPNTVPAITINQVCGSGLRAVMLGAQAIISGESELVIAGGQESMSNSHHSSFLRSGTKMGNISLTDTMIFDGLTDIFHNYHMGITAENVAKKYNISRKEQDEFALNSQLKAEKALKDNRFADEIIPIKIATKAGEVIVAKDEFPRAGSTIEGLSKLKPAFDKDGTVTAGNASGINDGSAILILTTLKKAESLGIKPLAYIKSFAHAGVAPEIMGTGPIVASKKALDKAGWKVQDLDLIEANEAFASQAIAVNKELGFDLSKVNVNGGAIALGHPIGASGARVLVSLIHELNKRKGSKLQKGLATLCIGGGMGVALCVEV